jgi:hypothetical protein
MVYFAPNMVFDFTMIEFWGWSAAQAEAHWQQEFADLTAHASQPIVHWPWHDYGPTIGEPDGYSEAMYQNLIATAYASGTEFTTLADTHQRIKILMGAGLQVTGTAPINVGVTATDVGRFSLQVQSDDVIQRVDGWYAYDDDTVFLPQNGGSFPVWLGSTADPVTRITALPMRANLVSLTGDGTELEYVFDGAGTVVIELDPEQADDLEASGADSTVRNGDVLEMTFDLEGTHTGTIGLGTGTAVLIRAVETPSEIDALPALIALELMNLAVVGLILIWRLRRDGGRTQA